MTKKEVNVDPLKALYYERLDELAREEDIIQRDITEDFFTFLLYKIENDELINIAIKGEVSGSKSTSAMSLMYDINKAIEKDKVKKIEMFKHIFSDQTEFLRFINTDETDVCIVIDEFSNLANTGLNSTTENALFDYYSNVFAQKYIHRISCSPGTILDANSNIILEFVGKNVDKKLSKFIVRYKNSARGLQEWTLGCVYIDVSNVLNKEFYTRYRKKKFDRMALLDKHGVRDIRELEWADTILKVVEELKDFVSDGVKGELSDMILAVISKVNRQNIRIQSILTTNEIASRCRNILSLYADLGKTGIKISKVKTEIEEKKLSKKITKIQEILMSEIKEQERRVQIYKEYLQI